MGKKQIDELLEENDAPKIEETSTRVENNFKRTEKDISSDISHVENRLSNIQIYITSLDTQMNNTKTLVQQEKDPSKKGKLYGVLNNCMELIVKFQDLYLKAMDIRYKYRREQVDFILKKTKLIEIDLRKYEDDSASDLNTSKLLQLIMNIQHQLEDYKETGEETEIQEKLKAVEDDDKYKI